VSKEGADINTSTDKEVVHKVGREQVATCLFLLFGT